MASFPKKFIVLLGKISSVTILTIIFIFVIGPYALLRKGFLFIHSSFLKQTYKNSFWVKKKIHPATLEELKRQF